MKITHLKNGIFWCDVCKKRFPTEAYRNAHYRSHSGERPFKCTFPGCNISMAQKSNLKKHMRKHTNEKPFKCPFCNKSYSDQSNLALRHLPLHNKSIVRYMCEICHKPVVQKSMIKLHMKSHEGWKFSNCTLCGNFSKVRKKKPGCLWCRPFHPKPVEQAIKRSTLIELDIFRPARDTGQGKIDFTHKLSRRIGLSSSPAAGPHTWRLISTSVTGPQQFSTLSGVG